MFSPVWILGKVASGKSPLLREKERTHGLETTLADFWLHITVGLSTPSSTETWLSWAAPQLPTFI